MANVTLAVTTFDPVSEQPRLDNIAGVTAAGAGEVNVFTNLPGTRLYLRNPTAGTITATIAAARATVLPADGAYGALPNAAMAVAVPAGAIVEVAIPPGRFNAADNTVSVTYSGEGLTALVLREV